VAPPAQAEAPRALAAPPAVPSGPGGERVGGQAQTALARPPSPPAPSIFRQPGAGGGGLRGGRGGVEGEPIPLDTPEPKYQDYFNKIREKIKANWIYPREAGDRGLQGELLLEFHIAKDGRLAFLELRNSSGAEILDRFAMNAVRLAQPFPPVPDDIAKQALSINGLFKYQIVGASLLNQYLR
jgi:protein TonB